MAKTRSQTGNITIKKEEEDSKDNLLLNGVTMTTRNKITKRTPPKNNNRPLPVPQVKVEEDADTKSLLKSTSKSVNRAKGRRVLQEQITQLIDYVVNHKMSITKTASTVNVSPATAYGYYNIYKNDPDKKIPLPRTGCTQHKTVYTQKQIEDFIRHIDKDKMTIKEASAKVGIPSKSGGYYYKKYLEDPDHKIPIPHLRRLYMQDQKNEFIRYIVNDKMSINAASKKAKMDHSAASKYYHKYFDNQNPDITAPSHITTFKNYTQEQKNQLISYIVDDKITVHAASKKLNMCHASASRHYHQYLKNHNMEIPESKFRTRYTQEQMNELMRYIVDDKMTIREASKKANIGLSTAQRYCYQYVKDNNLVVPTRQSITQDQIDKLIGYIIGDKMTITAASKKAKICYDSGRKYYIQYLNNQKRDALAWILRADPITNDD